jgi:hypothetical protein
MGKYAAGKYAYGISDRSGFRYRLKDMRKEWNGFLVGRDEYEPKHPQLEPKRRATDAEALRDPRPDPNADGNDYKVLIVYTNVGDGIIGKKLDTFSVAASVGTVTVSV